MRDGKYEKNEHADRYSQPRSSSRPRRRQRQERVNPVVELLASLVAVALIPLRRLARLVKKVARRRPLAVLAGAAIVVAAAFALRAGINFAHVKQQEAAAAQAQSEAAAAKQKAAQEAAYQAEVVTGARSNITYKAPRSFESSTQLTLLEQAVSAFESRGYGLSFVVYDLNTGNEISYKADTLRYSASSVKGPYCLALYSTAEKNGQELNASALVRPTLEVSNNTTYFQLRATYGDEVFRSWLEDLGIEPDRAQKMTENSFMDVSANEMCDIWTQGYFYLVSGSAGATELGSYLSAPWNSVIHALVDGTYQSWSKPGWYPGGEDSATNDAGIVRSDCGDYVLVMLTTAPEDFEALMPVADALNAAHGAIAGGATDSLITDATQIPMSDATDSDSTASDDA